MSLPQPVLRATLTSSGGSNSNSPHPTNSSGSASAFHSKPFSLSHSSPPTASNLSSFRSLTRSFFLGLGLALLVCLLHLLWLSHRHSLDGQQRTHSGGWRDGQMRRNLEAARRAAAAARSQQRLQGSDALTEADWVYLVEGESTTPHSHQNTLERMAREEEANYVQSLQASKKEAGEEAVAEAEPSHQRDAHSWQAQMAMARKLAVASDPDLPASTRMRMAQGEVVAGSHAPLAASQTTEGAADSGSASVSLNPSPLSSPSLPPARPHPLLTSPADQSYYASRTLILYLFTPHDQESMDNLEFFITHAVREHHAADYVIILQKLEGRVFDEDLLPKLPKNAKYVHFEQKEECGGLGPVGWLLAQQHASDEPSTSDGTPPSATVDSTSHPLFVAFGHYAYTMLVDSSMRGPWFPAWIDLDDPHRVWYAAFAYHLERHQPDMKLVGSTISCQYGQPHVQLGASMMDREGWALVDQQRDALLSCVPNWRSTAYQAMDLSRTMLQHGFNIGSQMLSFQEVDFRLQESASQTCLGLESADPQYEELKGLDIGSEGYFMDPYEVVFIKYTAMYKHYKSQTFTDWKRWEKERGENNKRSPKYLRRWTEKDFRREEPIKSEEERARLQVPKP